MCQMHFLSVLLCSLITVGLVAAAEESVKEIPETCRSAYEAYTQCLFDSNNMSEEPTSEPSIDWDGSDLTLTHYWDCSGQACDSRTLQPWDFSKYRSPPGYAPQDPEDFGGSVYGEKVWVTAAFMNIDLGDDDPCCGSDDDLGCGKCVLISNPSSIHPEWTVLAMKKNTIGGGIIRPHVDINVPGYDDLEYSLANICGEQETGLTKDESSKLGKWYQSFPTTKEAGKALCGKLPEGYRKGCELFSAWGWTGGKTDSANYKIIDCPPRFKEHIGGLFDKDGVVGRPPSSAQTESPTSPPTSPPTSSPTSSFTSSPTSAPKPSPPGADCAPVWDSCGGKSFAVRECCEGFVCTYSNDWYSQCLPE